MEVEKKTGRRCYHIHNAHGLARCCKESLTEEDFCNEHLRRGYEGYTKREVELIGQAYSDALSDLGGQLNPDRSDRKIWREIIYLRGGW